VQLELPFKIANFFGATAPPPERSAPPPPIRAGPPDCGRDEEWTDWCADAVRKLGMPRLAGRVEVVWNRRLKTTAGLADCRNWRIELNPRLKDFEPTEPVHTVRHELAHLVAQARAGRQRIACHGTEWRQACADLGIPGERAFHDLPLPRRRQKRNWVYRCPACNAVYERVRKMRYAAACSDCCRLHARGRFSERFLLVETRLEEN
jgi:predicted SprT family Zn-dependent metalloprotease